MAETVKTGVRYKFSEPFRSELERALKGHAPWKAAMPQTQPDYKPIPPTDKQLAFIKRLGGKQVPASKADASKMIEELLGR